jgi:osmoprotectant transport system substrate-binding protein
VIRTRRALLFAGLASAALALSSCAANDVSSGSASSSASSGTSSSAPGKTVVIGGASFTEMQIMEAMYADLLKGAGYQTKTVTADNRELYFDQLTKGDIQVVPEYAATFTDFLNRQEKGQDAPTIATNDPTTTIAAAAPLAAAKGLVLLDPAQAADQNAFAVTTGFAKKNNLKTLSDLAALGQPVTLAATTECPTRPYCGQGLKTTYGIQIANNLALGFDTSQTKLSVQNGESQLGLVATTDGTLDQFNLVVLEDDKHLQLADNLVPVVTDALSKDPKVTKALNSLSNVLTTDDLAALDAQVDGQRLLPADVAHTYLQDKGLIK